MEDQDKPKSKAGTIFGIGFILVVLLFGGRHGLFVDLNSSAILSNKTPMQLW